MLVEALDTFAKILQKIAPAQNLAKDWEAQLGTARNTFFCKISHVRVEP